MGCELSRFARQKSVSESHLTAQDMVRLAQIWDMINVDLVCLRALVAVLSSKPQLLSYFGIATTEPEELIECTRVISHAKMIASFLTTIVRNLDTETGNADLLLSSVGAIHFQKGVNFTAENYLVFKRMFANSMSEQVARANCDQMNPFRKLTNSSMRSKASVSVSVSVSFGMDYRMGSDDVIIEKFLALVVRKLREGFLSEAVRDRPKTAKLISA